MTAGSRSNYFNHKMRHLALPIPRRFRPLEGSSSLPVYELDRAEVQAGSLSNSLFCRLTGRTSKSDLALQNAMQNNQRKLTFGAWPFFHAVKKTELAHTVSRRELNRQARAFADDRGHLTVWNLDNFRLRKDGCRYYKDSSRTFTAGRFGEGLANLFMYDEGYRFWDHLPTLLERARGLATAHQHWEQLPRARLVRSRWIRRRLEKQPDFVHENRNRNVALMEAKGSFVAPDRGTDDVARRLKKALSQLANWDRYVSPIPQKSYAVASYLRELGDSRESFLAFVDPLAFFFYGSNESTRFPDDWIRRGNYGAWLIGMGLASSGEALRHRMTVVPQRIELPVLKLPQGLFAYTIDSVLYDTEPARNTRTLVRSIETIFRHPDIWHWRRSLADLFVRGAFRITGLRVEVLRHLNAPLTIADDQSLTEIDTILDETSTTLAEGYAIQDGEGFYGSSFPDGSLHGAINVTHSQLQNQQFQTFDL